ncbi:MAG: hypothetical protein GX664_04225 [Bacteroidales bacterium]|nr:hypothetical protein [Bacteroidales bacterium]
MNVTEETTIRYSGNLLKSPNLEDTANWIIEGSPTSSEMGILLNDGDTATQVVDLESVGGGESISHRILTIEFFGRICAITDSDLNKTLGSVSVTVENSDGTSNTKMFFVTGKGSLCQYMDEAFDVDYGDEVVPTRVIVRLVGTGQIRVDRLDLRMEYLFVKRAVSDELPANLVRNSSFEIFENGVPAYWEGNMTIAEKAYALNYGNFPDEHSLCITANTFMQYTGRIGVGSNGMLISWYASGEGGRYEIFGDDRSILASGTAGGLTDEWRRKFKVLPYKILKDASSIGIRFMGDGTMQGEVYIDGIKVEELNLPSGMEYDAEPSAWLPHEEDVIIDETSFLKLASIKIGDVDYITQFTKEMVQDVLDGGEPTPVIIPFDHLQQFTGLEVVPREDVPPEHCHVTIAGTVYAIDDEELKNRKFPLEAGEKISIMVTDSPLETFNPKFHNHQVFELVFVEPMEGTYTDFVETFMIGNVDCLILSDLSINAEALEYIRDNSHVISAPVEIMTEEVLRGVTLVFNEAGKKLQVTAFVVTADGRMTTEAWTPNWGKDLELPMGEVTTVGFILSNGPLTEESFVTAFGITVKMVGKEYYWLSEFRIGDIDCLELSGVQLRSVYYEPTAVIEYEDFYQHEGFILRLKEEYADYTLKFIEVYANVYVEEYDYNYPTHGDMKLPVRDYYDRGQTALIVVVSNPDNTKHQYFGVRFVEKEPEPTITTYRNIETIPLSINYYEEEKVYSCQVDFYHRELGGGNKISVKEGEVLTGLTYLILEEYIGGMVTFYVTFGSYRSPYITQYVVSGEDLVIPFPYTIKATRRQDVYLLGQSANSNEDEIISERLYFNFKIQNWGLNLKFDYGSLSGAIEDIYYEGGGHA